MYQASTLHLKFIDAAALPPVSEGLLVQADKALPYLDIEGARSHGDNLLLALGQEQDILGGVEFSTDERRVGFADALHINRIEVLPDAQGRGIASRLLTCAFGEACLRGVAQVRVTYFSGEGERLLRPVAKRLADYHAADFSTTLDCGPY